LDSEAEHAHNKIARIAARAQKNSHSIVRSQGISRQNRPVLPDACSLLTVCHQRNLRLIEPWSSLLSLSCDDVVPLDSVEVLTRYGRPNSELYAPRGLNQRGKNDDSAQPVIFAGGRCRFIKPEQADYAIFDALSCQA